MWMKLAELEKKKWSWKITDGVRERNWRGQKKREDNI